MSCKRYYHCDLCGSSIEQGTGIGIFHEITGGMRAVYFTQSHVPGQVARWLRRHFGERHPSLRKYP